MTGDGTDPLLRYHIERDAVADRRRRRRRRTFATVLVAALIATAIVVWRQRSNARIEETVASLRAQRAHMNSISNSVLGPTSVAPEHLTVLGCGADGFVRLEGVSSEVLSNGYDIDTMSRPWTSVGQATWLAFDRHAAAIAFDDRYRSVEDFRAKFLCRDGELVSIDSILRER